MGSSLDVEKPATSKRNKSSIDQNPRDHIGTIQNTLGTGNNARDGIVYYVLWWCFAIASLLSILVIYNSWVFRENEKVPDMVGDLSEVWKIMTPLITLALGYLFGKSKK